MNKILIALLLACGAAYGYETGPANTVLRSPPAGGRMVAGAINLSAPAAIASVLPVINGGLGVSGAAFNGPLVFASGVPGPANINLSTQVSGQLPSANGGLGINASTINSPSSPIVFVSGTPVPTPIASLVPPIQLAHWMGTLSWAKTSGCSWSNNGTSSFTAFSAVSACPSPTVTSPSSEVASASTKIPGLTISSMSPGIIHIDATGEFESQGTGCVWEFSDGTNSSANGWNFANGGSVSPGFPHLIGNIYYSSGISSTKNISIYSICFSSSTAIISVQDQTTSFTMDVSYQPIQGLL